MKMNLKVFPSHFSKGMKQKVMIICAFIVDPELYIDNRTFPRFRSFGDTVYVRFNGRKKK